MKKGDLVRLNPQGLGTYSQLDRNTLGMVVKEARVNDIVRNDPEIRIFLYDHFKEYWVTAACWEVVDEKG